MNKHRNCPRTLSLAVAAALVTATTPLLAQDGEMEEIVVTGIRGSLTSAMDIKRSSDGVVDAISAQKKLASFQMRTLLNRCSE